MSSEPADSPTRFSLVLGGPFHGLLERVGLTGSDSLPTARTALVLALLAWLPPALLALAESLVRGESPDLRFYSDWTVHTRYLIGIAVLVGTERYAEGRIILLTRQFRDAQILHDDAVPGFLRALDRADRRSSSALAEGVLLAAAFAWSGFIESYVVIEAGSSWEGRLVDGQVVLSWAGEMTRFVSNPLFIFLVLRWVWRFGVWTALLFRISRLPLQLTPLHPDRSAGLGFMSIYPSIFSGFVFALSWVIASSLLKQQAFDELGGDELWFALGGWIVFNVLLFIGPLLVFLPPLYRLRERAVVDYGRLASQHHLIFQRKWVEEGRDGAELVGSPEPSSVSDLNASVETVRGMRLVPVDGPAIVQLLLSAGLPLLVVVATQIPLTQLARWILGTIL